MITYFIGCFFYFISFELLTKDDGKIQPKENTGRQLFESNNFLDVPHSDRYNRWFLDVSSDPAIKQHDPSNKNHVMTD